MTELPKEFSITKISFSNDEFKISQTCSIQSKIIKNTICLIDDLIVFYTTAGLFIFDGNDIKQIFNNVTKNITSYIKKAVVFNNKYYLNCGYFINDISTNLILEFDLENDTCFMYDIGEIVDIYVTKGLLSYSLNATITDGTAYNVFTLDSKTITSFNKYIKFNKVVFDDKAIKVLTDLKIQSVGDFKLTISTDLNVNTFYLKDIMYLKNLGIKGQYFEFEIESKNSFLIESISLKITELEED